MISWMQHHKKYLIITIWVSVIAFVGAGFVGWGSYNLNPSKADAVAIVGDEKIGLEEFNTKYFNLYNNYALMDKNFSQEKAQLMGLKALVLNDLIVQKLFINFAKSLGLRVSEDELLKTIAGQRAFYKDGVFQKDLYYSRLKQNGYTPKLYEKLLKDELLQAKLFKALNVEVTPTEVAMLSSSTTMKDSLNIALIKVKDKEISIDEKKLKALWEKTKQNYKSKKSYILEIYFFKPPMISDNAKLKAFYEKHKLDYKKLDGELLSYDEALAKVAIDASLDAAKLDADRKFVSLKKGKTPFVKEIIIQDSDKTYPDLSSLKEGQTMKPFIKNDGYLIVKLKKIKPSTMLDYMAAKKAVISLYLEKERKKLLEIKAKESIKKGFNGIYTGFVDKASLKPGDIDFLSQDEFSEFLAKVFDSNVPQSFVLFNDKAIVYKIIKQKLPAINKRSQNPNQAYLLQNAKQIKDNLLKNELIKVLQKQYKITKYYKGI